MKKKYLKILRCPDCRRSFKTKAVFKSHHREIINGFLACECRTVPVLEGIPVLIKGGVSPRIASYLNKYGQEDEPIPFFLFQRFLPNGAIRWLSQSRFFERLSLNQYLRLMLIAGAVNFQWYRYLTKRVSPSLNFASEIPQRQDKTVDLGCGSGELLRKLKRVPFKLGVDVNLANLYLAEKYLSPTSDYLCHNLNHPLPFKERGFDVVISNDAFHYVRAKKLLTGEISRILKKRSSLFLGHVHNLLVIKPPFSFPVTPKALLKMFPGFRVIAFRENRIGLSPVQPGDSDSLPFLNFLFYRGGIKASR